MFFYDSPLGVFTIRQEAGRFVLCLDDEILGRYASPNAAANDVYMQCTGSFAWDGCLLLPDAPTGLDDWQYA